MEIRRVGKRSALWVNIQSFSNVEFCIFHGCTMWEIHVMIPEQLCNHILLELLENHIGIEKIRHGQPNHRTTHVDYIRPSGTHVPNC